MARTCILQVSFGVRYKHAYTGASDWIPSYTALQLFTDFALIDARLRRFRAWKMRTTLRRSCNACAKAKLGCDLRVPQCSRCVKRKSKCVYANSPLNTPLGVNGSSAGTKGHSSSHVAAKNESEALSVASQEREMVSRPSENPGLLINPATASFDPFDSYPSTRLPRLHVQRLIHRCKSFYLMSDIFDSFTR